MTFNEFDRRMRLFETSSDQFALPGIHLVARLDGRGFTHLIRKVHRFQAPFDVRFRDLMVSTVEHLMARCGFRIIYGYTQSDEISLLFHRDEDSFGRKLQKYISVIAGEASARFSLQLGSPASFDCRVSQLPLAEYVCDYFRWRAEDAHRKCLNGYCYWMLRNRGHSTEKTSALLYKMSVSEKNELLFSGGINYNDLPAWQRYGTGLFWEIYPKEGRNPLMRVPVVANRKRLRFEFELPSKDLYSDFILRLMGVLASR